MVWRGSRAGVGGVVGWCDVCLCVWVCSVGGCRQLRLCGGSLGGMIGGRAWPGAVEGGVGDILVLVCVFVCGVLCV